MGSILLRVPATHLACDPADGSREGLAEGLGRAIQPPGDLGPAQLLAHQFPDRALVGTEPALNLGQGSLVALQQLAKDQALAGRWLGRDRNRRRGWEP